MKKIALYSGLFDPFTRGHLNIVIRTLRQCDKVYIGVENDECTFSAAERVKMIRQTISDLLSFSLGAVQYRDEIINRVREHPEIIEVVAIKGEVVDTAIACGANVMVRGVRNEYDVHFEEEIQDRIMLQFKIRNYQIMSYNLEQTNGEVIHMSSTVTKELCCRGEFIAALHHVTPRVHNLLMWHYLRPLFDELFPRQRTLWNRLSDIYLKRCHRNFMHVGYLLNRLFIEKAQGKVTGNCKTLQRAMFLYDVGGDAQESALWVEENLHSEDAGKIAAIIRGADFAAAIPARDSESFVLARCNLLLLTDAENYGLYRRLIQIDEEQLDKGVCYENLSDFCAYVKATNIFSCAEFEKAKSILKIFLK